MTEEEEERLRQWWRQVFAACGYGLVVMGSFGSGAPLAERVDSLDDLRIPAPTEK